MRYRLMAASAMIALMADTGSGSGAPPPPSATAAPPPPPAPTKPDEKTAPKPASAKTVAKTTRAKTTRAKAPAEPKQSKDGPPVVAALTPERDGEQVQDTQIAGFAPGVEHVDGENGSDGDPSQDPALAVEPGQAIDQSGGNPVAQNLTTAASAIDVSPRVQANGRYAEAGPDHGDLPPDPTTASEAIHAKVQEVRDAHAEGDRNVAAGRRADAERQRKSANKGGHKA